MFLLAVTGVRAVDATLEWDPNTETDLSGYRLHYGTASGAYSNTLDVGNTTRATVPNLTAGQTYFFAATAYNTAGLESAPSNEVSFTASGTNQPPAVTMSGPADGSTFIAPATITLSANASDADGAIARVAFFSGATKLGEVSSSPFSFTWTNVPAGAYQLTAVATDNLGASATSVPVAISVSNPNQAPSVALTSPAGSAIYAAPASILISAGASDSDGTVTRVEFFSGNVKLGEKTAAPFEIAWNNVPAGSYTLTAVAWDDRGASATSASVAVIVNAPPAVALNTNGSTFVAPATITMDAVPSDSDGTVTRVDFYNGDVKLGERASAPFSWALSSAPAGSYALRAMAVDNRGATAWSNEVLVTVVAANEAPTVALTSPQDGTSFVAPAAISISASASDTDGTVARVEFFAGAALIGQSTTSPFAFEWRNVPSGTHHLTAVAYDNLGASATSAVVKVSVNAPPAVSISITTASGTTSVGAGSSLTFYATASDSDGVVRKIEFYSGTILLGKDMNSPYRFVWKNVPAGTHVFTAVAYDNQGASTRSDPVTVTVVSDGQAAVSSSALPSVRPLGRGYDDAFELQLVGQAGDIYDVWWSEDLKTWSLLVSVLNPEGEVTVSDDFASQAGARFYRVSLH